MAGDRNSNWKKRLLKHFDRQCRSFDSVWKKVQRIQSTKSVHDLRVAIRKQLSCLELLSAMADQSAIDEFAAKLKKIQRVLGPLRDLDVQIPLATSTKPVADIAAFIEYLQRERRKEQTKAQKKLRRRHRKKLAEDIETIRTKIMPLGQSTSAARRVVEEMIRERSAEYASAVGTRPGNSVKKLHAIRIASRRLRFALETATSVFPQIDDDRLPELRACQRKIGKMRDRQLLRKSVERWVNGSR